MKILGINYSLDAAASIVEDGHVLGAVAEERFSRIKHDGAFPVRAIDWCLQQTDSGMADIDHVAFFWNPGIHCEPANWRMTATLRHHLEYLYAVPVQLMRHFDGKQVQRVEQTLWLDGGHPLRIHFLTHHDCHAAAAFYRSNFDRAAILTVDGYGERSSTQICRGQGSQLETLRQFEFPHSLGSFYAAFTQYLGFRPNSGEGKVMGLASYGDPSYYDVIRNLVKMDDEGFELDLSFFSYYLPRTRRYSAKLIDLLGPERAPESELNQRHMDIAASVQKVSEELLCHLAKMTRAMTGETKLCMAGGVTLNCVANARIRYETGFDTVYFMPASGDAGASIGAALYVAHVMHDLPRLQHPESDALGPSFTDDQIEADLRKAGVTYRCCTDICAETAQLLATGKMIGWFQGSAELGPRALGQRSILADPRNPEMKDTLNARVKYREAFRPFAPSVLAERCAEFFEHDDPSPYMLLVYDTRQDKRDTLPSITHVDGGARVQTVTESQNPRYYALIKAFGDITGVPVLLNTSFNIRGEPIVNNVHDALKCFFTTGLDALAIGSFLLRKGD